ncbi:hypothetical protein [Kribbella sp. NPDC051770]|uniref:hypothetical protein n=1 Tax=Kribbella sp. NPDC051770 TaxID=3155413 RepID=UPI0034308C7D
MAWIGGAPGAGKSTIARTLACSLDLPLHPIDRWTYDHAGRMAPVRPLDLDLADGPEAAADAFVRIARTRLALAVEDVRARGLSGVPALVEGPQLFPSMAADVPAAVWLLPDAEQTRRAREARLARVEDPEAAARLEGLLARDAVLAQRVRDEAALHGRAVIEVPAEPDWPSITTAVRAQLDKLPRLAPGEDLARQREIENLATCRQLRLWAADINLADVPAFDFTCECGRSGCCRTWSATPDQYDVRRTTGRLVIRR